MYIFLIYVTSEDFRACINVAPYEIIAALIQKPWSIRLEPRNHEICVLYARGKYMTKQIAESKHMSRRQVERIVKQGGVLRSRHDSNLVAGSLRPRHRIRSV